MNDFVPKFLPQSYFKAVDEDTRELGDEEDRKVLTVFAKDDDEGANAHVIYAIVRGNEEGYFLLLSIFIFNENSFYPLEKKKRFSRKRQWQK